MNQLKVIILTPFLVIVYTMSTIVTYFKLGFEVGLTLCDLLNIKNVTRLLKLYISGFKDINEQIDIIYRG